MRQRFAGEAPYAIGLLIGATLLVWSGYLDRSAGVVRGNDFAGFWAGARAIVEGYDPFRVADWPALAEALGGQRPDTPVYGYPGWVAVALVPFGLMPLATASALWTFGGLAIAAAAVRMLLRMAIPELPIVHTLVGVTLLASQSARTAVILGQWTFILVAALSVAAMLAGRRPVAAGLGAIALLAKPHLFLLAYPALIFHAFRLGRGWLYATALLIGALALIAASLIVLPGWPSMWLSVVPGHRLLDPPQTTTIPALLSGLLGPAGGVLTAVIGGICLVVAALFRPGSRTGLGIWISLSLIVAPYQWSYDHLLLLPAIVLVASGIEAASRRRAVLTASTACSILLVLGTLLAAQAASSGTETLAAVTPALTLAVLVIGAWPLRDRVPRLGGA
jgi:hypothetical protein